MAGPWEQFTKAAQTVADNGPWKAFQSQAPKTEQQVRRDARYRVSGDFGKVTDVMTDTLSMGLGDEMAGIGNAIFSGFKSGSYQKGRDEYKSDIAQTRAELPNASTLADIAGFAGSLGPAVVGTVGRGAVSLGQAIKRAASSGGIMGAISGAAGADGGVMERASGGVIGGTLGGLTGGALPIIGRVAAPVAKAVSKLARGEPLPIAPRMIADALRADGIAPKQAAKLIADAQKNGVPLALADMGDNTRELFASVGRKAGPSRTIVRDMAIGRQEGQTDRLAGAVARDLGPVANPRKVSEALIAKAKTDAAPLYKQAYAAPTPITDELQSLLKRMPASALNNAQRVAKLEGRDPNTLGVAFDEAGDIKLVGKPTVETLDFIKRGLDDVVEKYRDKTTGALVLDGEGRVTNNLLRDFTKEVDRLNPVYKEAREAYAGPVKAAAALKKGQSFINKTADDIVAETERMSRFQLDQYRLGVRAAMTSAIENKGDYADKVSMLVQSPKKRAALAQIFGGKGNFERFMTTLAQEKQAGLGYKAVAGNSSTAGRLADDATTGDQGLMNVAIDAASAASSPVTSTLSALSRIGKEIGGDRAAKLGEETRGQIAAALSETDPARLAQAIQAARRVGFSANQIAKANQRLADLTGRGAGVASGQVFNLLNGSQ